MQAADALKHLSMAPAHTKKLRMRRSANKNKDINWEKPNPTNPTSLTQAL